MLVGLGGFLRPEELSARAGRSNALAATHIGVRLHTLLLLRSWLVITSELGLTMRFYWSSYQKICYILLTKTKLRVITSHICSCSSLAVKCSLVVCYTIFWSLSSKNLRQIRFSFACLYKMSEIAFLWFSMINALNAIVSRKSYWIFDLC